jgi:hypothetical protein
MGKCGLCPVFASYTLAFVLQLRKKHGQTSVRVAQYNNNEHNTRQMKAQLSYLAALGREKISASYFKQCFFRGGGGGGTTPQVL